MDKELKFISFSVFYNGTRCNTVKSIRLPFLKFELKQKELSKLDKNIIIKKAIDLYPNTPIEKIEVSMEEDKKCMQDGLIDLEYNKLSDYANYLSWFISKKDIKAYNN